MKPAVGLTDRVTSELKLYFEKQRKPGATLKIFVIAGGCSGLF